MALMRDLNGAVIGRASLAVGRGRLSPERGGKELWSRFGAFLQQAPADSVVSAMTGERDDLRWSRRATNRAGKIDAVAQPVARTRSTATSTTAAVASWTRPRDRSTRSSRLFTVPSGTPISPATSVTVGASTSIRRHTAL